MINLVYNDDLLSVRSELLKQYHDIHSVETRESIQKAKIKWAVEGDENSKFFHGMINRKRANLAVKGVMIDGEWVDDPRTQVLEAATLIGCSVLHTPFKYLGIMVGENMSSIRAWDETVNKLKMSLSSWKLKTLSIGGRLNSSQVVDLVLSVSRSIVVVAWSITCFTRLQHKVTLSASNSSLYSCLRLSYPRLFALENNKVCSVAAKMSAPFVLSLRRDVRGGEESAQLSRISDLLDTVVFLTWGSSVLGP
ncbi:hypothetical protein Tco_0468346 [Tanacetum coccineum]